MGEYLIADGEKAPGMGGVFNSRNLQTYHYAGNNPIKYYDPTGESTASNIFSGIALITRFIPHPVAQAISHGSAAVAGFLILDEILNADEGENPTQEQEDTTANPTQVQTPATTTGGSGGNNDDDKENPNVKDKDKLEWDDKQDAHIFTGKFNPKTGKWNGGHLNKAAASQKTQFPSKMSQSEIKTKIVDAARKSTNWRVNPDNGYHVTEVEVEGIGLVRVVVNPKTNTIVSTFPVEPTTQPAS